MLFFHFVFWDKSLRVFVWNHAVIEKIKSALCMFSNVIVVVEILFVQCTSLWLLFISRLLVGFYGQCGRNKYGTIDVVDIVRCNYNGWWLSYYGAQSRIDFVFRQPSFFRFASLLNVISLIWL